MGLPVWLQEYERHQRLLIGFNRFLITVQQAVGYAQTVECVSFVGPILDPTPS